MPRSRPTASWVTAADLAADGDPERLRRLLAAWAAPDAEQEETRARMLAFLAEHGSRAFDRACAPGHFTGSAFVVDAEGRRGLLTHHRKLGRWLQLGGHADGDTNLVHVALREAREESGIEALAIEPAPLDLDVHAIPARGAEPEHLHLDVRFLVRAAPDARARASAESTRLGWFTPAEAHALELDASTRRLFELALGGGRSRGGAPPAAGA